MAAKPQQSGWMKFLSDLFQGPDGETWAIGRIYSFPVLCVGLAAPILALMKGQDLNLAELGGGLAGVAGAVLLLVRGNNTVDYDPKHLPPSAPLIGTAPPPPASE